MLLDENTGEVISLQEAQDLISEFGKKYPDEVMSFFMGGNNVKSILIQNDCIGVRIYNGYDVKEDRMNQVLVGVDSNGNDMKAGIILDRSAVCPPICPTNSILN